MPPIGGVVSHHKISPVTFPCNPVALANQVNPPANGSPFLDSTLNQSPGASGSPGTSWMGVGVERSCTVTVIVEFEGFVMRTLLIHRSVKCSSVGTVGTILFKTKLVLPGVFTLDSSAHHAIQLCGLRRPAGLRGGGGGAIGATGWANVSARPSASSGESRPRFCIDSLASSTNRSLRSW